MIIEVPALLFALVKSVLPGIGTGFIIDLIRNYGRGPVRTIVREVATHAAGAVGDLFTEPPPVRTESPAPRQVRTGAAANPVVPQPLTALGLDPLTLEVLTRAGLLTIQQLQSIDDLQTIPGVGMTRAAQISAALEAYHARAID